MLMTVISCVLLSNAIFRLKPVSVRAPLYKMGMDYCEYVLIGLKIILSIPLTSQSVQTIVGGRSTILILTAFFSLHRGHFPP